MALLRFVLASLALTACYEPELRDCTLACNAEADCADGHLCGSDGLCARPEIAGQCAEMPSPAGSESRDAGVDDATVSDPNVDAATHVPLDIKIEGKGRVNVTGYGFCDAAPPHGGTCTILVPRGALRTISADAHPGWRFDRWTTASCASTSINTCTFSPNGPTPIGVKFKNNGGGDD